MTDKPLSTAAQTNHPLSQLRTTYWDGDLPIRTPSLIGEFPHHHNSWGLVLDDPGETSKKIRIVSAEKRLRQKQFRFEKTSAKSSVVLYKTYGPLPASSKRTPPLKKKTKNLNNFYNACS